MAFFGPFAQSAIDFVSNTGKRFIQNEVTNYATEFATTGKIGVDSDMSNFDPKKPPTAAERASAQFRYDMGLMSREKYDSIMNFEKYVNRRIEDPVGYTKYINGVKVFVDKQGNPLPIVSNSQPDQGLATITIKNDPKKNVYRPPLKIEDIKIVNDNDDNQALLKIDRPITQTDAIVNKVGADVGALVIHSCKNQFEEGMNTEEAFKKAVEDTGTGYLANSFLDFHKKVSGLVAPMGYKYREIEQIYNGRNLSIQNNLKSGMDNDGKKIWLLTDEIGTKFTYKEPSGYIALPAFDTWGGPFSVNNKDPETISGLFYQFHDIDYTNYGYFDVESDFKLISRLDNNIERMETSGEVSFANLAIQWFSTAGWTLAAIKGKLTSSNRDDVETVDNNILFYFLQRDGIVPKTVDYSEVSGQFNKGIDESAKTNMEEITAVRNPIKRREYFNTIRKRAQDDLIRNLDVYI